MFQIFQGEIKILSFSYVFCIILLLLIIFIIFHGLMLFNSINFYKVSKPQCQRLTSRCLGKLERVLLHIARYYCIFFI